MMKYKSSEVSWVALESLVVPQCTSERNISHRFNEREGRNVCTRYQFKCIPTSAFGGGFMNGTKILMQNAGIPAVKKRAVYSGHKRIPCLVYQTITSHDGLKFNMLGLKLGEAMT